MSKSIKIQHHKKELLADLNIFYDEISAAVELEIGAATFWAGVFELMAGELGAAVLAEDRGFLDFGLYFYAGK